MDYSGSIYQKNVLIKIEYFRTSASATLWVKSECEKNHYYRGEVWWGWTRKLSQYRRHGKTLKFSRS